MQVRHCLASINNVVEKLIFKHNNDIINLLSIMMKFIFIIFISCVFAYGPPRPPQMSISKSSLRFYIISFCSNNANDTKYQELCNTDKNINTNVLRIIDNLCKNGADKTLCDKYADYNGFIKHEKQMILAIIITCSVFAGCIICIVSALILIRYKKYVDRTYNNNVNTVNNCQESIHYTTPNNCEL